MNLLTDEEIEYYLNKLKSDVKLENHIAEQDSYEGIGYAAKKLHIGRKYMKIIYDIWRKDYVSSINNEEVKKSGSRYDRHYSSPRRKPSRNPKVNGKATSN